MILYLIAVILLFYLIFFAPKCATSGVTKIFTYKTLHGDKQIAYIGHICPHNRPYIINSIFNNVDIILGNLTETPVKSVCKKYLKKRGWIKIGYHPPTVFQAAEIEKLAVQDLIITPPSPPNITCLDTPECGASDCSSADALKNCPNTCNSCGVDPSQLDSSSSACVISTDLEFPWLF